MKKWLSVCLALLLTMTVCTPVGASENTTGACTWTLDGTHLTISGNGRMADYEFACGPWGQDITSVTIEDGVTSIGNYAFFDCSHLTSVTIPDSVTAIGENAFEDCTALTAVTLPKRLERLELRTFADCTALQTVVIPNSIKIIGIAAFDNCDSLTEINIPEGVTTIEGGAFVGCDNLRRVSLPDSVTSIGEGAFRHIPAIMDKANRYQGVVYFGNHAIEHLDPDYEEIHIRAGTKTIAAHTFDASTRLTAIAIPDSVIAIGAYAFSRCSHLQNVYYAGNEAGKSNIQTADGNDSLLNATWHYGATKIPTATTTAIITTTTSVILTTVTTDAVTTVVTETIAPTQVDPTTSVTPTTSEVIEVSEKTNADPDHSGVIGGFAIRVAIGIVLAVLASAAVVIIILQMRKKKK